MIIIQRRERTGCWNYGYSAQRRRVQLHALALSYLRTVTEFAGLLDDLPRLVLCVTAQHPAFSKPIELMRFLSIVHRRRLAVRWASPKETSGGFNAQARAGRLYSDLALNITEARLPGLHRFKRATAMAARRSRAKFQRVGKLAGGFGIDARWYSWVGSNHRPPVPQTGALTN